MLARWTVVGCLRVRVCDALTGGPVAAPRGHLAEARSPRADPPALAATAILLYRMYLWDCLQRLQRDVAQDHMGSPVTCGHHFRSSK